METRKYEITGDPKQLDILERVLGRIEELGSVGCSRTIKIFVDGDGAARLKIRKDDQPLNSEDITLEGGSFMKTDDNGDIKADLGKLYQFLN